MNSVAKKGKRGEEAAEKFLIKKGLEIIGRRVRAGHKEIDLLAKEGGQLVFVEVKAIWERSFGHPEERVTRTKKKKLVEAAYDYLERNKMPEVPFRWDFVGIDFSQKPPEFVHITDFLEE
jgi:putative endonuclease